MSLTHKKKLLQRKLRSSGVLCLRVGISLLCDVFPPVLRFFSAECLMTREVLSKAVFGNRNDSVSVLAVTYKLISCVF